MEKEQNELSKLFFDPLMTCPISGIPFSNSLSTTKNFIIARGTLEGTGKQIFYTAKLLCKEIFENNISHTYKIKIKSMKEPQNLGKFEKIEFFAIKEVSYFENEDSTMNECSYKAIFIGNHNDFIKNSFLRDQICDCLDYLTINFNDNFANKKKEQIWYSIFSILLSVLITIFLFYVLEKRHNKSKYEKIGNKESSNLDITKLDTGLANLEPKKFEKNINLAKSANLRNKRQMNLEFPGIYK